MCFEDEVQEALHDVTIEELEEAINNLTESLIRTPYRFIIDSPDVIVALIDCWNEIILVNPEFDIELYKRDDKEEIVILKPRTKKYLPRYKIYVNWVNGLICAYSDKIGWWFPLPGYDDNECL